MGARSVDLCFRVVNRRSHKDIQFLYETPVAFINLHGVDLLLTPVRRVDRLSLRVKDRRHLVAENFNDGLLG